MKLPMRVVVLVLAMAACPARLATEPVKAQPAPPVAEAPTPEPAPVNEAKQEPAPAPEPVPAPEPEPPPARGTLAKAVPGVAVWEERPELADIQGFHPLPMGVLAECGPDGNAWCELGRDGRLSPSKLAAPEDEDIVGIWPSDAWRVKREEDDRMGDDPMEDSHSIWVTVDLQRWNGKRFASKGRFELEVDAAYELMGEPSVTTRKGWAGGMLLRDHFNLRHVPATKPRVELPGDPWEVFETASGTLVLVAHRGNHKLTVHALCPQRGCKASPGFVLQPETTDMYAWTFPLDVARGGDSLTIVAEHEEEGAYLLHYDAPSTKSDSKGTSATGTFRLEAVPVRVGTSMLWPDAHGGLWLEANDELWYRDASGRWLEVEPPGGLPFDYANRLDPREFLVLVVDADRTKRVLATKLPATPAP